VNSFRFIKQALEYEIERQVNSSNPAARWCRNRGFTTPMKAGRTPCARRAGARLPLLFLSRICCCPVVDAGWQAEIRKQLRSCPKRGVRGWCGIWDTEQDAGVLTVTKNFADQFEEAARASKSPKRVANLCQGELQSRLKVITWRSSQSPISMKGVALSADLAEGWHALEQNAEGSYDLCFERNQDFPEVYEKEKPQQIRTLEPSKK